MSGPTMKWANKKSGPEGLGIFIWLVSKADGGDWQKIAERCKLAGLKWVAVDCGQSSRWGQWTPDKAKFATDYLHEAGLSVFTWNYSRPSTWPAEASLIADVLTHDGVDGHIIDAEGEWKDPAHKALAVNFGKRLRDAMGPDRWIAHCPFDYINYHLDFPYDEFGAFTDAVMPQEYWTEHGVPYHQMARQVDPQWTAFHAKNGKPVIPVGVTYGSEYAGSKVPGKFTFTDLADFVLDHRDRSPAVGFYSYEAACPAFWESMNGMERERQELADKAYAAAEQAAAEPAHDTDPPPPTDPSRQS